MMIVDIDCSEDNNGSDDNDGAADVCEWCLQSRWWQDVKKTEEDNLESLVLLEMIIIVCVCKWALGIISSPAVASWQAATEPIWLGRLRNTGR